MADIMEPQVTSRQKEFLRALGHRDFSNLSKGDASSLIDKLLDDEKASGRTFPCPYCKHKFGPRPRRTKKCPNCGQKIIHLSGKFYTADKADEKYQKDWMKEQRLEMKELVREDWREEKSFRKEFDEPMFAGYIVHVGQECSADVDFKNLIVLLEDAYDAPEVLPPFDTCRHDACECEVELELNDSITSPHVKIVDIIDPDLASKLKTRANSPQSIFRVRRSTPRKRRRP